jgi:hypothetical protein
VDDSTRPKVSFRDSFAGRGQVAGDFGTLYLTPALNEVSISTSKGRNFLAVTAGSGPYCGVHAPLVYTLPITCAACRNMGKDPT